MNEYKGIPFARMHAHGYRCVRPFVRPCSRGCQCKVSIQKPGSTFDE